MLIDTHSHLYLEEFDADRDEVMGRAWEAGIHEVYLPNIDSSTIAAMLSMEAAYPGRCFPMMGLHPGSVKENFRDELKVVERWLSERPFCAVGEIGIDLYWDKTFLEFQKEAFLTQVNWAKELGLPIVIHSRESIDLIIQLLKGEKDERLRGIFHCFTGTLEQAEEIFRLGFYVGIGGVLTFKKSGLDETVKKIPLDQIVLETDSPYLAPTPHRGKRNESAFIQLIATQLALIKEVELEEVASVTTGNAKKILKKNNSLHNSLLNLPHLSSVKKIA